VIQNVIGAPSPAVQIIFEMQSQGTSQKKKSSKENTFFPTAKHFFFSFFFILTPPTFKPHNFLISYSFQAI